MALTLNQTFGAETGGEEELSFAQAGVDGSEATIVRSGARSLKCSASGAWQIPWVDPSVTDAGSAYIAGIAFRTDNTGLIELFGAMDDTGSGKIINVTMLAGGQLQLRDAAGSTLDSSVGTNYNDGAWHYIQVYAQLNSASGDWEWFIDGVSEGSGSGADLTDGNGFGGSGSLYQAGGGSDANPIYYDDLQIFSGATAASDRLGGSTLDSMPQVLGAYQNTVEDATDQGDALADGTWALVGELPGNEGASNDAQYVDTGNLTGSTICDEGDRPGPAEAAAFDSAVSSGDEAWGSIGQEQIAGSFSVNTTRTIDRLEFEVWKNNTPTDDINVEIVNDSSGDPSGSVVASATVANGDLPTSSGTRTSVAITAALTGGTTYWIRLSRQGSLHATDNFRWGSGDDGTASKTLFSGTWSNRTKASEVTVYWDQYDVTGTIVGAKWIGRFKRGTGGGITHSFLIGNDGDGVSAKTVALITAYETFTYISEAPGEVPLSTENFQHGFQKSATGGQDMFCGDIWATLLHVPSGAAGVTIAVPLATISLANQVPAVASGKNIAVPLDAQAVTDQVPQVGTSALVSVPLDGIAEAGQAPAVASGKSVAVPLDAISIADQVPAVVTGARVASPLDPLTLADLVPAVGTSALVLPPVDAVNVTDRVPAVATGASAAVPLDAQAVTDQVPQVGTSAAIIVPLDTISFTDFVPTVASGVAVLPPVDAVSMTNFVPAVAAGGIVINVPLNALAETDLVPIVAAGASVASPLDGIILADLVPRVGTSVLVVSPLDVISIADLVPAVASGASAASPLNAIGLSDLVPAIGTGVLLIVPLDAITETGFIPVVGTGARALSPVDGISLNDLVPAVGTSVLVLSPVDGISLNNLVPAVGTGVLVLPPVDTMSVAGLIPAVATGAAVVIPLDALIVLGLLPIISATSVLVPDQRDFAVGPGGRSFAVGPGGRLLLKVSGRTGFKVKT